MIAKLLRAGVVSLVLGCMTGCDSCNKKPDVPVTERAPASGAPLAAGVAGCAAWARCS